MYNLLTSLAITTRLTDFSRNTSFQALLLFARLQQLDTPIDDRASSIWSFQRIQGRPLRRLPQTPSIKHPSHRSVLFYSNDFAEPPQPLDINMLHNVCHWGAHKAYCCIGCRNHRQLALERRSYEGVFSRILSRQLHQCQIGSMPLSHKAARVGWASFRVLVMSYERGLCYSIETIVAPVGKSDPVFDLQTNIIFGGNVGAKINKYLDCIKSIVIGRNLRINTPHVFTCR